MRHLQETTSGVRIPYHRFAVILFLVIAAPSRTGAAGPVVLDATAAAVSPLSSRGYLSHGTAADAFFSNPARLSRTGDGSVLSAFGTERAGAAPLNAVLSRPSEPFLEYLVGRLSNDSFGGQARAGYSFVYQGWGYGAVALAVADGVRDSDNAPGTADIDIGIAFPTGFSHAVKAGDFGISLGASAVPNIRGTTGDVRLDRLESAFSERRPMQHILAEMDEIALSTGVGFHAGAAVEWTSFGASLELRDIGHTRYAMFHTTGSDLLEGRLGGPVGGYLTPMTLHSILEFSPVSEGFDPKITVGWIQPLASARLADAAGYGSWYDSLILTAEARLDDAVNLRAGVRGGDPGAGMAVGTDIVNLDAFVVLDDRRLEANIEVAVTF